MPLFRPGYRTSGKEGWPGGGRQKKTRRTKPRPRGVDDEGSVSSLTQLCLLSVADNMATLWVRDYADNYLDKYWFRHIVGPFNVLPCHLVEELTHMLSSRKQLSRAAIHLLLVPQLRSLSLAGCPGLVTPAVCSLIAARCQVLSTLDVSGAQQLPAQAQCAMLSCLPSLRSVVLAGTPCDRRVIGTLVRRCRALRHLDVSRCHLLSPAALLPLGGTANGSPSSSSSSSPSSGPSSTSHQASCPPLPLSSLLALDIGFGEEEGDPVAATAYLLLALPCLQRAAMDGLAQACCLIQRREFGRADGLAAREELPGLEEVWRERRRRERMEEEAEEEAGGEERAWPWSTSESESEGEEAGGDQGPRPSCFWGPEENGHGDAQNNKGREKERLQRESAPKLPGRTKEESFTLRLREIQGLSFSSLEAVGRLCPDICSVALDYDSNEDSLPLAVGLRCWASGQLRSLTVRYPHALSDLLPSVHFVASHLASLTLEGVKTGPQTPLLELLGACPRLRELSVSAEPGPFQMEEVVEGEEGEELRDEERDHHHHLPCLPHLHTLTLNFSYDHGIMRPVMYWRSLQRAIKCLLSGSPLLEKVSLVSLPCPLNSVLRCVLLTPPSRGHLRHHHVAGAAAAGPWSDPHLAPPRPLGRLQQLCVARTDVTPVVVREVLDGCKWLRHLDLTCCWNVDQSSMFSFHRETLTVLWR